VIVSAHDGYPRWLDSGADFIELDIRRTRRHVVVLAHDPLRWWRRYVRFDEIVERVPATMGLHLDLKEEGYEREFLTRVLERWPANRVVVTPEHSDAAATIKAGFPDVRVSPLDFVTVDHTYATEQVLAAAKKPIWVWTVDDESQMRRFFSDQRIECVITNRPDLALRLRTARA
jgi:glycerophosphoryl diester phosphodiesterase